MSWNKPANSGSWDQDDVSPYVMSRQSMHVKGKNSTEKEYQPLPNKTEKWNVTKRKRSGGGRMRSANVRQDGVGDTRVVTVTPAMFEKDGEAVQDMTGISTQAGMDSPNLLKHKTKLLPTGHIENFLAGKPKMPGVRKRKMEFTRSEDQVPRNTIVSSFIDERPNEKKSAGTLPNNGGPLFKRLLSALIDENQDFDHVSDGKADPSTMQKWEMDFLSSVPDENLLLKELHLVGIYPEILPGLVEKEDDTQLDNKDSQEVIYPKLVSEPPLQTRKKPRSRIVKKPTTEENKTGSTYNPNSGTKKKRGRPPKNIDETKSKKATRSAPKVSMQEVKSASPPRPTRPLVTEDESIKGLETLDLSNPPEDLNSMLDLNDLDDYLPQDGDDLSCLDIPMDDISSLNLSFFP